MLADDRRGQTFIEAMVAITIIVTAVTSALALVQSSITSTRVSGSQVIAANLAREGLEVVRSLRDSNWLAGRAFHVGLVDASAKTARAVLDTSSATWAVEFEALELSGDGARLYLLPDGTHVQAASQPSGSRVSPYRRLLVLDHVCRDDVLGTERVVEGPATCLSTETLVAIAATSTVDFPGIAGFRRTVSAEERFYDWR